LIEATAARFVSMRSVEAECRGRQGARRGLACATTLDCVVARALGQLADFIGVAGHLCTRGGRLLAMKGRRPDAEMIGLPAGWRVVAVHELRIPGLAAARCIVELGRA
jgi:16S rRNA (guanine527-N7)-methyltransferase